MQPTAYPEVNQVLYDFLAQIRAILGDQFVGMYLYGSLALGDFDPHGSDIDFAVVTETDLSDAQFAALREMHAQFSVSPSRWARKIEAAYLPLEALNHAQPTSAQYPQIETITELIKAPLEIGWPFQRHSLREHGVIVAGANPKPLIDPVDPADMHRSIAAIIGDWFTQAHNNIDWVDWLRQRPNYSFVVLTLCRCLYALALGDLTSKPTAARWAQQTYGERWSTLIELALAGQHQVGIVHASDLAATSHMIDFTYHEANGSGVSES